MKLILAEIPTNGSSSMSTSISANVVDGVYKLNVSQSVNKSFPDGANENESINKPISGTAAEVAAKVAELGLTDLIG